MAYSKEYWKQYSSKNKEKIANYRKKRTQKNLKWIFDYKTDKCCEACGWKEHPELLQFHHLHSKFETISQMRQRRSIEVIEQEIKKCIILCPNCHMWHHYCHSKGIFNQGPC